MRDVIRQLETREEVARRRSVPLGPVTLTSTAAPGDALGGSERVGAMEIKHLVASNITGSATTVSVLVGTTVVASAVPISANSVIDLSEALGCFYENGTELFAFAGSANSVVVSGWFEDVF